MLFAPHVIVMSSAFFNPSFAFSSHFDADGAPLSELSWPSSLAVVAVSFSGLFTFIFLMLACLCCKKGDIGFKEFDNNEGEEYQADLASSNSQNGPEVYILPLTEVSLPVSKQPGRSIQLLKSSDLGRHSLLYLKEIGYGWFGKVLLGEVNAGLSTTQVVVKELKASASVQDQMQFLEEVQQYRTLQHPALLQCLAQCTEVTPYLLVMEFCPLGDLKTYLHSCRVADAETPDPLILQRMACDIASGLLHLHKHNVIHSDLALRNCLLSSEMTVKIGDYGLSHSRYKEDYYITQDQIWVALRWIAPELIDEVHGNLLVVDQTKSSNIWSLGVTVWELFELGDQPYRQYSDRQVLTYVVKEQQLKLPKPQIQFPLVERWYEVMQFCWLQPELRPCSEEVHLLVTYLCAKGSCEAEEDFEQRWNTLKPNLLGSDTHTATATALLLTPTPPQAEANSTEPAQTVELASSASSSFPLLEHFSDSFHSDTGDDLLTVTETSHGLNFEYKWEQARSEQPYCSSSTSGPLGQGNPHYQDIYYSSKDSTSGGCRTDSLTSGVSLSYYEPEHPGVVPVLSAHSPSVSSEYYIRIEEPVECSINLEDTAVDYSPVLEAQNSRLFCESPPVSSAAVSRAYWSTADRSGEYDSDSSPADKLTTDPLLKQASSPSCLPPHQDGTVLCRQSCRSELDSSPEYESKLLSSVRCLENSRNLSQAVSSPSLGFCDPYLEASSGHDAEKESCNNVLDALRKTQPLANHISIDVESEEGLLVGQQGGDNCEDDRLSEGDATNWTSNCSANNNSLMFDNRQAVSGQDSYLDFHFVDHCNNTQSRSLSKPTTKNFQNSTSSESGSSSCNQPSELTSYIHPSRTEVDKTAAHFELNNSRSSGVGGRPYSEPQMIPENSFIKSPSSFKDSQSGPTAFTDKHRGHIWDGVPSAVNCPETLENTRGAEGRVGGRESSSALVDIGDYSEDEDDMADITSGIFADFNLDYAEVDDEELSPVKHSDETASSADVLNLSSSMVSPSDQAFSPFNTTILPKSLDSGYDTENNESPEFFFKELGDPQESERSPRLAGDPDLVLLVGLGQGVCASTSNSELHLKSLTDKTTYRDSAYFSDYDAENERSPQKRGGQFFSSPNNQELNSENVSCVKTDETLIRHVNNENVTNLRHKKSYVAVKFSTANGSSPPALSMLAPFPPQMGGCLTKESAPAEDDLGLDTEQSGEGEEVSSDFSSIASEPSSTVQESSVNRAEGDRKSEDSSSVKSTSSDSNQSDSKDEASKENDVSTEEEDLPEFSHTEEERTESVRINEEDFEDIDADESDSQDSLCEQSNGPGELSTSSSLLELYGEEVRAPLEQAEDEEDSDDSESDDELRTYNIHEEESEESEEDFTAVPVVVSDCSRARHLRSLLKMPGLLTQTFCDDMERKKKAVSFFDDVTVYLFDQESPTGELANYTFPGAAEPCGNNPSDGKTCDLEPQTEPGLEDEACETGISEDAVDENSPDGCAEREEEAEELEHPPSPKDPNPVSQIPPTSITKTTDAAKPAAVALNRFLVSRFSITQVSDSHMNANTGDSEESSRD